jgi:uncharacterized protein YcbX
LRHVPITVAELSIAPVKGMQVAAVEAVEIEPQGPRGDREFLVVDASGGELLLTTRTPALSEVEPAWDEEREVLELRFPDGRVVEAAPGAGEPAVTRNYEGREIRGGRIGGPLAEALSEHLGRPVRLLRRDPATTGADDFPVTLMSRASLRALAPAVGGTVPDARRFRMTLLLDGLEAWEEHGWTGRDVVVGDAVLRVADPVPRCVVTTRDPRSGRRDVPMLRALAELRGKDDVTFGMWCTVRAPGRIRRGDAVLPG